MNEQDFSIDAHGIPAAYQRAVTDFAKQLDLDPQALLRGDQLECGGIHFCLEHYGEHDPHGVTVIVELGEVPKARETEVYRYLLEHNLLTAAGVHGYFGMIPQSQRAVFCVRIALDHVVDGGGAIACLVASLVQGMEQLTDLLQRPAQDAAPTGTLKH